MTWHLKDRELEEALNKKSHPMHTFTDELNKKMAQIPKKELPRVLGAVVTFQRIGTGGVILEGNVLEFSIEEIENVADYNPNEWNSSPYVTPPEGILMRVETACDSATYRECAIFEDGIWKSERNGKADDELYGKVKRFRPWEN